MARFAIGGGGTGGHVAPALALGEAFAASGDELLFVGTRRGVETRQVPQAGFELLALDARPLLGRGPIDQVRALFALGRATAQARRALRRFGAEVVISVGGYASVPPALAARSLGIPILLLNPDASPGLANRLVARFAARICAGFETGAQAFAKHGQPDPRVVITGVPLREALCRAFAGARAAATPADGRTRLFVFGGSQGSEQINGTLVSALPRLDPKAWSIVHQTGERDRAEVERAYAVAGFEACVLAFEPDMATRYRWADLVLCRAGAITIAELSLTGRPALLVPLPHVGGGEQFANARELSRCGAARVLDSNDLHAEDLALALIELAADPRELADMGRRAAGRARPDAARAVAAEARALLPAREKAA